MSRVKASRPYRSKNGKKITRRAHSRRTLQPKRAWKNAKRGYKAARRKQYAWAATCGTVAAVEAGSWFALKGTGIVLASIGMLAIGGYALSKRATG